MQSECKQASATQWKRSNPNTPKHSTHLNQNQNQNHHTRGELHQNNSDRSATQTITTYAVHPTLASTGHPTQCRVPCNLLCMIADHCQIAPTQARSENESINDASTQDRKHHRTQSATPPEKHPPFQQIPPSWRVASKQTESVRC
jgi:hypothetical protein